MWKLLAAEDLAQCYDLNIIDANDIYTGCLKSHKTRCLGQYNSKAIWNVIHYLINIQNVARDENKFANRIYWHAHLTEVNYYNILNITE